MATVRILGAFFGCCIVFASSETVSNPQKEATDDLQKLSVANYELQHNLFSTLASQTPKNVFFSPISVSIAFGMLFSGTGGDTAEELRNVLGYEYADLPSDLIPVTFNRFLREIVNKTDTTEGCVLKAANAVLIDKHIELHEKYRNDVTELFEAAVRDLDFSRHSPEIVEEINSWVSEKTDGKINNLFDDLNPSTLMVLLNAIYFKGTWKTQFNPEETTEEIFYNNFERSEGRNVSMMHVTSLFPYESGDIFQTLELPFKNENLSMVILLPNTHDRLQSLQESLTPAKLSEILERLEETMVDVSLPRFKLDFDADLSGAMQELGANQIFSAGGDFSGMTSSAGVFVSEVRHKAILEVSEEGSEAAAVTGNLIDRMKNPQFRVDIPFLFAITEKSSDEDLFYGRVNSL